VFEGKTDTTRFGLFDRDDNVYTRVRWSFRRSPAAGGDP
jgi:hypothetical protein